MEVEAVNVDVSGVCPDFLELGSNPLLEARGESLHTSKEWDSGRFQVTYRGDKSLTPEVALKLDTSPVITS